MRSLENGGHLNLYNFQFRVCHYLGDDKGRGGSRQTVTKCDKGERGSKIDGRPVTYVFSGPLQSKKCKKLRNAQRGRGSMILLHTIM